MAHSECKYLLSSLTFMYNKLTNFAGEIIVSILFSAFELKTSWNEPYDGLLCIHFGKRPVWWQCKIMYLDDQWRRFHVFNLLLILVLVQMQRFMLRVKRKEKSLMILIIFKKIDSCSFNSILVHQTNIK